MTFNSLGFALFLPPVFLLFHAAPQGHRWLLLLIASYAFYASLGSPLLVVALLAVSVATYAAGLLVARSASAAARRSALWAGIAFSLLALVGLRWAPWQGPGDAVPVAIGVSYYTLQAISYLVDVAAGATPAETHPGYLALHLAFFPRLLQGPIERASDLLPQLRRPRAFAYEEARHGLLLFAWGLFKKTMVADPMGAYVDAAYRDVHAHAGLPLLLATYAYAAQIYFDFSGYTDMALGTARLFGIRLTQNFNSPYRATSVAEFWRRWHISLSRWLLDYVFRPLQMALRHWNTAGTAVALLVTFLLCGLWHGGSARFAVWGLLHGTFMAIGFSTAAWRRRIGRTVASAAPPRTATPLVADSWRIALTFHLVCFAWIFFRASTLSDAVFVSTHLFSGIGPLVPFVLSLGPQHLAVTVASLVLAAAAAGQDRDAIASDRFRSLHPLARWATYYALAGAVLWSLVFRYSEPFIYFRF